jgi:hypothetical protein
MKFVALYFALIVVGFDCVDLQQSCQVCLNESRSNCIWCARDGCRNEPPEGSYFDCGIQNVYRRQIECPVKQDETYATFNTAIISIISLTFVISLLLVLGYYLQRRSTVVENFAIIYLISLDPLC